MVKMELQLLTSQRLKLPNQPIFKPEM